MTRAYYNEIDPHAAQWLRNLIDAGLIAFGDVDERDIRDINPDELRGYTQCHFFAGIGIWSYALRLAGWPDDRPVWTGSPPCQPFSAAGRGAGVADERHLWPHWHHLIRECRPEQVFGEQVASKDGLGWLDLVQSDMEGTDYACGAVDLCAAGVGAPHIRQRQFFFFSALGTPDAPRHGWGKERPGGTWAGWTGPSNNSAIRSLAYPDGGESGQAGSLQPSGQHRQQQEDGGVSRGPSCSVRSGQVRSDTLANPDTRPVSISRWGSEGGNGQRPDCSDDHGSTGRPCPTNGFWRDVDWLFCRDGKWRPVESSTFPLVDGSTFRLDSGSAFAGKSRAQLLRGAGNAIVSEAAAHIIASFLEAETDEIAALDARRGSVTLIEDLL